MQETLSACTKLNVQQMHAALDEIFRTHSRAFRHDYKENLQLLDIDMSGMPCGPQQEESRQGYFSEAGIRYGRQLGRIVATHYEEIVTDQLFAGNVQLIRALPALIAADEATLALDGAVKLNVICECCVHYVGDNDLPTPTYWGHFRRFWVNLTIPRGGV